jgi:hypothetical protein
MQPEPPVFTGWLAGLWERLYRSWEDDRATCQERFPTIFRGAAASTLPDDGEVERIWVPALVLAWNSDPGHPVSTADQLGSLLPHADLDITGDPQVIAGWPDRVSRFVDAQT